MKTIRIQQYVPLQIQIHMTQKLNVSLNINPFCYIDVELYHQRICEMILSMHSIVANNVK